MYKHWITPITFQMSHMELSELKNCRAPNEAPKDQFHTIIVNNLDIIAVRLFMSKEKHMYSTIEQ